MHRGKSTRLPSAAPVFEYQGRLYEGRPAAQCLGCVDAFDETKITLLADDDYANPWIVLSPDEPRLRPRTKAARELLAHALAALDEQIDAEIERLNAAYVAGYPERDDAVDAIRYAFGVDPAAPNGDKCVGVVASKQGDVITVHEIVELGEGVERLTIEIDPVQS